MVHKINPVGEESYKINPVGNDIRARLYGIPNGIVTDNVLLEKIMDEAIQVENYTVKHKMSDLWKPHGLTLCYIISESHFVLHTYPELHYAQVDISTCRGPDCGEDSLSYILKHISHEKHVIERSKSIKDINLLEQGA